MLSKNMIYEENIIQKDYKNIDIRFGLSYPNVYRTAMSSLGYNLLYNLLNQRQDTWCERIIYPNTKSIESNTPLNNFNIISFSLQFEQDYFNVLKLLKQSNIPLKRDERNNQHPLIIAGGPCATANPLPLSDYIDLFIIGEGEITLNKLIDSYLENSKNLKKYLKIPGIYIPKYNNNTKISIIKDLNTNYQPTKPIIIHSNNNEYKNVFSNSIMLNVSRGCSRGCRFCMTSYLYRPTRECSVDNLVETAIKTRNNTGLNKVTLIGPAVSDYSDIEKLINKLKDENFQISMPSLRIESLTKEVLESLKESGLKTITLAPESIFKLRQRINKEISDETIFSVVKNAADLDFNIKLYFLIGIPYETMKDMTELSEYIKKIANLHNNPKKIKFSINPIIPKPHTPLQWTGYDFKEIKRKTRFLKKQLKKYEVKFESPKEGLIQYILSCGNKDIGFVIEKSLTKDITIKEWKEYLPNYTIESPLPWDVIDVGVSKEFLKKENEKIKTLTQTPWCEKSKCYKCGACI